MSSRHSSGRVDGAAGGLPALGANLVDDVLEFLQAARSQHDTPALGGKFTRQRLADSRRCARHDDDLVLEILFHYLLFMFFVLFPVRRAGGFAPPLRTAVYSSPIST